MGRVGVWMVLGAVVAAGCGGKESPAAPTPPPVTGVTVSGPDTVLLGGSATYTATITGGSGATCAWSQDAASVGTVAAGTFTAVGNGAVTIWCDASGVRGTKRITVIPNFGGRWTGTYVVTGCSSSGFFAAPPNSCDSFRPGNVLPFSAVLTQTGTNVTGSFNLGSLTASQQSGAIVGDGFSMLLTYEGTNTIGLRANWTVRQSSPNQMAGSLRQMWTTTTIAGDMTVNADISTVVRSGAAVAGVAGKVRAPGTLGEMFGRLGE